MSLFYGRLIETLILTAYPFIETIVRNLATLIYQRWLSEGSTSKKCKVNNTANLKSASKSP